MTTPDNARALLEAAIEQELLTPVDGPAAAAADDLRNRLGPSVVAVLFYGSCLATGQYRDKVLDFYVLLDSYGAAWGAKSALARANALLPPNVFYAETAARDGDGAFVLRAKYATLTLDHFAKLTGRDCFNSSVWARFAQPARLVWSRDDATTRRVTAAVAQALVTTAAEALPLEPATFTIPHLWIRAFTETYRAELRSERPDKGREIYLANQDRYDTLSPFVLACIGSGLTDGGRYFRPLDFMSPSDAQRRWALRRIEGKAVSLARLAKASFTFDGGIDYLAWKIGRHSGVEIEVTPWQRRHPVLAGLTMFWKLRWKGAFR